MKILGIVGSPRKNGNTDILVESALISAKKFDFEIEKLYLSDYQFSDCIGCNGCSKTNKCVLKDGMQEIYKKLEQADAIVLGSPTYFYNVTGITKTFLDRLYAYEIFDSEDRSVWLSVNEVLGIKYAVTIAVCEQNNEQDMGYTSIVMDKTLQAVGYRVVDSVKILHAFSKGDVVNIDKSVQSAVEAGKKLAKTLLLAKSVKNSYKEIIE